MKKICLFSFLLLLLLIFISNSFAVTLNILDYPSEINNNEDIFTINVEIIGARTGTNYLGVELYKDSETDSFGETKINDNWYGDKEGKYYFPISIVTGNVATASFNARIGNTNLSKYLGQGSYNLHIQRYTSSGNPADDDQNDIKSVQINYILPSPTLIPTPNPTPTPTPASSPNPTVTPKPAPTKSPTPKPSVKLITAKNDEAATPEGDILGENIVSKSSSESDKIASNSGKSSQNYLGWIFFTAGIFLSSSAGFLAFQKAKEGKVLI